MWTDLNTAGQSPFGNEYDVCVCGSGPAGITTARKLAARGKRVLLLEAGGVEPSAASIDVYRGKSVGATYWGVESCRLRYFGGTSNHWTGLCGVFDDIDFAARDIWGLPGWPITRKQAYAHIDEAAEILDLPGGLFSKSAPPGFSAERFQEAALQKSPPTRFGEKYRSELQNSDNVDVVINANVTGFALSLDGARVDSIDIADYDNRRFTARAAHYVFAFGALENARFLLNADRRLSGALSAKTDFIGKCFMEHFNILMGRFIVTNPKFWMQHSAIEIAPRAAALSAMGVGNSVLSINSNARLTYYGRLAPMRRAMRETVCAAPGLTKFSRRFWEFPCPGDGIVTTIMEQCPDPASRVTLDDSKTDAFGGQRLILDWQINDVDRKTMRDLAIDLGKGFVQSSLGRLRINSDVMTGEADLGMHCHQMGTTRMSENGRTGVVDGDCKLHGIDNLFIGGSSVFPTGGGVNPTFTIVCLALRMGEHIADLLDA